MAVRLDGKAIAAEIQADVAAHVEAEASRGRTYTLAVILVGDHPASATYVRNKQRTADKVGIASQLIQLGEDISEAELLAEVERLNADPAVDGILVQLPLPSHVATTEVLQRIDPQKDVDGFHPVNAGRNFVGLDAVWPCTPAGIMEMLRRSDIDVAGKHAVVVGRSNIVGKPMAMMLLEANATVTICHSQTPNLEEITRQADILVVAVGRPNLIRATGVKPGAVVIDVGMNRVDGKLTGDVAFAEVELVAGAITPVPGGVGPLTIAMLMANTVCLGEWRRGVGVN
ncbi:bifunctional methylenetetrahydrofolate dehydrogenase/methenyltetrahydrofolate cyclohydrolase FolD [Alicyclobacillus sp. ALC3]|uniref:bifunctional methylenetetrahydrofolate dehydrogenase/methenyltetrahydrofolate cyclohydrolase FolD n=1 Tax=Alicyclobacillus sp. ALC3 TaxID=2796143 RepID=UPI0023790133|nr:bifunctional methylenetetrahydrofolate dehydrogenase/methenyltetrahydrofolate cyclohydrolase FolD [Alicyclobacillus sp. ALC3]WDL97031.1 bifunctional methylenetetrahydrofolate dehydrogenase/methenyltetrahydrofolate cyclohydrolase FolD [Alicyclobacillus sp. ALC3]